MDLLRACKEVRGMPSDSRKASPARPSAMGAAPAEPNAAASLSGTGSNPPRVRPASAMHVSQTMPKVIPSRSCRHSRPDSVECTESRKPVTRREGSLSLRCGCSGDGLVARPGMQTPGKQAQHTDVTVVFNRTLPFHRCGKRAPWRTGKQRLEPARCCDCSLQFLFLHGSRHLPFPFRNARVEVGPAVMEG